MSDPNKNRFVLDFIDEQKQQTRPEQRIYVETLRDESMINFNDLLERDWSVNDNHDNSNKFFRFKQNPPEQQVLPDILQKSGGHIGEFQAKFKAENEKKQNKKQQPIMQSIFTVFDQPQYIEDIEMYLSSELFTLFIRTIVIINLIGLFLVDFQYRIDKINNVYTGISLKNAISLHLQLYANCVFTLQIILQFFSTKVSFSNPWIVLNIVGTVSCWGTIFMPIEQYEDDFIYIILTITKNLRGLRIIQVFECLKKPFEVFIATLPSLNKIFFPLLVFMSFYAIVGQSLFIGANETRCRATQAPVNNIWPQIDNQLCGSSAWQCPQGYCGNPNDYKLPSNETQIRYDSKQYGLVSFNDFFKSMLTVYHYVFLSNWTGIIFKFSKNINPILTSLYFVSMAVVLFFILANLIFISLSKAYIQKQKLLEKSKLNSQKSEQEDSKNDLGDSGKYDPLTQSYSGFLKGINLIEAGLIIFQCILVAWDYKNMTNYARSRVQQMDFVISVIGLIIILTKTVITRFRIFFYNSLNLLDIIVVLCFLVDALYCVSSQNSLIYCETDISSILRSIKVIRIIKNLYVSDAILKYQRNIINLFFQTLKNMRYFLLLLACIVLNFSFIGEMLFAFRVRFNTNNQIDYQGAPYVSNYQTWYKSIVSIVLLFENERWTETMYNYYHATGAWALLFYASVAFFVHLMLTRLFMAVFLCYFRRDLEKSMQHTNQGESTQSICKQNSKNDVSNQKNPKNNPFEPSFVDEQNDCESGSYNGSRNTEPQSARSDRAKGQANINQTGYIFWIVPRNSCLIQLIRIFHNSRMFYWFTIIGIFMHCITILARSNHRSVSFDQTLDKIQSASICVYCSEVFLGVLSYGLYFEKGSYLKRSNFNKLNIIVLLLAILSIIPVIDPLYQQIIRRLVVIKVFTVLKSRSKQTDIILEAIAQIFKNFIRIVFVYIFFLFMASIIPLKLLKDSLYSCYEPYVFGDIAPKTAVDCMNAGGDWVEDSQNFNNVFNAITLMYQIVASESWTYFIELTIPKSKYWDIYFVTVFFFYNVCLLNIFVGLTVQTYLDLKDKAYRLNLLLPSQRGWILIKNCINELVPEPIIECNHFRGFMHKVAYRIITDQTYKNIIDILAYFNIILYALTVYRSSESILLVLFYTKMGILAIFCIDTILKLYALKWEYFYLENSRVQLVGLFYTVCIAVFQVFELTHQQQRIIEFFLVILLFLRCKKFLFRFTWSKTLINSVIEILPKCIQIFTFLGIVLFVYVAIGLEVFKHVKPTAKSDGYTTGFDTFFTGMITLLKIASNESWFDQVTVFVRNSRPNDICYNIGSQQEADAHSGMGCGNMLVYPFFFTYHMTMALLIFNLLIATMISAYDENYQKEYNSVNVFQLQDCLELWKKYDPLGKGVIPYKKFWKLSSQIGILFGISKKKLIKSKQKFLQQLDIPICQSINPEQSSVLCYRFHDVITKFSKIKLQVSLDKGDENSSSFEFDIHPMVEKQIRDFTTKVPEELYKNYRQFKSYTSGQMKYLFGLLRKLRSWRTHSKSKGQIKISKLSRIIKVAMEKKVQDQNLKNLLAFCTGDGKSLRRKKSTRPAKNEQELEQESQEELKSDDDMIEDIQQGQQQQEYGSSYGKQITSYKYQSQAPPQFDYEQQDGINDDSDNDGYSKKGNKDYKKR